MRLTRLAVSNRPAGIGRKSLELRQPGIHRRHPEGILRTCRRTVVAVERLAAPDHGLAVLNGQCLLGAHRYAHPAADAPVRIDGRCHFTKGELFFGFRHLFRPCRLTRVDAALVLSFLKFSQRK